jgi:NAD(P)-dependent dehydrogenase (short-subunit alcohol dehydrogenase family)
LCNHPAIITIHYLLHHSIHPTLTFLPSMPAAPQRILIIGGASGIGAALTISIIQTSNAQVFLFDKSIDYSASGPLGILLRYPNRMYGHEADVTIPSDREHAVETCVRADVLGGIDTVVYCAGVITPIERIEGMNIGRVEDTYGVNVFGAMAMVLISSSHRNTIHLTITWDRRNLHSRICAPPA